MATSAIAAVAATAQPSYQEARIEPPRMAAATRFTAATLPRLKPQSVWLPVNSR